MVNIGEMAPAFELPGTAGDRTSTHRLGEYTDGGAVVPVFHPFDFSPVCTEMLCAFRDSECLTFTKDVDVSGISPDCCYAPQQFIDESNLPFPLLSDTVGKVTDQYGLADDEWDHLEGVPKRAPVTVDDSHTVRYKWQTERAYESPNFDDLHQAVLSLSARAGS